MKSPRFYPKYAGKEGFEERYEVIDSSTGEAVTGKLTYHAANDEAEIRNRGPSSHWFGQGWVLAILDTPP